MSEPTITRGRAAAVGLSSVYSAAVAYVTLLAAARTLSPADNAIFLVYWAVLFGAFGIVTGVSPESARASYLGPKGHRGAMVVGIALAYAGIVAVALALSAPMWAPVILPGHAGLSTVAIIACVAYSGHLSLWGVLTGDRRWPAVAGLLIAESTARLVLVVLALALSDTLASLAVAAALPALTWVATLALPTFRQASRQRSDVTAARLLGNFGLSSMASASSSLIMVGFPILIAATSTPDELAGAAALMLGISLTRAPLLVPLTALQGVALAYFLRNRHRGLRALWSILAPLLCLTVIGAGLAYLIGPWLFQVLLGPSYRLDSWTLATLTVSAGLLATLTLSGMYALALHRHRLFAAGWVIATVVAVSLLKLPVALTDRVLISLLVGPLVGVAVHVIGLSLSAGRPDRPMGQLPSTGSPGPTASSD